MTRPIVVAIGKVGESTACHERATISRFGIRGIGSVFFLLFAINRGVYRRAWRFGQAIDGRYKRRKSVAA